MQADKMADLREKIVMLETVASLMQELAAPMRLEEKLEEQRLRIKKLEEENGDLRDLADAARDLVTYYDAVDSVPDHLIMDLKRGLEELQMM